MAFGARDGTGKLVSVDNADTCVAVVDPADTADALCALFSLCQWSAGDEVLEALSYLAFWTANAPPTLPPIVPPINRIASTRIVQNRCGRKPRILGVLGGDSSSFSHWTTVALAGERNGDGDCQGV